MIELNKKTQQDFLNREWVQRLLDAGVDMSDAKYWIGLFREGETITEKIFYKKEVSFKDSLEYEIKTGYKLDMCPTYTVSELLYKLHEYLYKFAPICGSVDILRYTSFACSVDEDNYHEILFPSSGPQSYIEQLAYLLIQCHQKDIGTESKE